MSTQTKVPDFEMIDEYNKKFNEATTEEEILEVIKKTTDKKTLLIISHDSKIAPIITREINVCTK